MCEWIECKERMPESKPGLWSEDVIVLMQDGEIFSASAMGDYWQRKEVMIEHGEVVAWMPIPDMP